MKRFADFLSSQILILKKWTIKILEFNIVASKKFHKITMNDDFKFESLAVKNNRLHTFGYLIEGSFNNTRGWNFYHNQINGGGILNSEGQNYAKLIVI